MKTLMRARACLVYIYLANHFQWLEVIQSQFTTQLIYVSIFFLLHKHIHRIVKLKNSMIKIKINVSANSITLGFGAIKPNSIRFILHACKKKITWTLFAKCVYFHFDIFQFCAARGSSKFSIHWRYSWWGYKIKSRFFPPIKPHIQKIRERTSSWIRTGFCFHFCSV